MRTVHVVVAAVLLFSLAAGSTLAKDEAQQGAKTAVQPKPKGVAKPQAKKAAKPKIAEGLLPKGYVIRNIQAGVRKEQDTPMVRDICSGFRFTEGEVREYFRKAYVISEHVRQYGYQTLPCYVSGEIVMNEKGETAAWEIEASAAGKIQFQNGNVVNVGCRAACREMFDKK